MYIQTIKQKFVYTNVYIQEKAVKLRLVAVCIYSWKIMVYIQIEFVYT